MHSLLGLVLTWENWMNLYLAGWGKPMSREQSEISRLEGYGREAANILIYLSGPSNSDQMTDRDRGSISSPELIRSLLESCSSISHFSCRENRRPHHWNLINKKKRFWDCKFLGCIPLGFFNLFWDCVSKDKDHGVVTVCCLREHYSKILTLQNMKYLVLLLSEQYNLSAFNYSQPLSWCSVLFFFLIISIWNWGHLLSVCFLWQSEILARDHTFPCICILSWSTWTLKDWNQPLKSLYTSIVSTSGMVPVPFPQGFFSQEAYSIG